jgi:hypothetical protein
MLFKKLKDLFLIFPSLFVLKDNYPGKIFAGACKNNQANTNRWVSRWREIHNTRHIV